MSIKDVIKSSIYASLGGSEDMPLTVVILVLAIACIIGAYIFFAYKFFCNTEFYSKDLNISIAVMPIIIAAIMLAMQSNLLVSLGMVGALSIVRFRTAVKNPMDLSYLFWAISAGIICGVRLYALAIVLCCIMTIAIWVMKHIPGIKAPGVLVVRGKDNADLDEIEKVIKEKVKYVKPKTNRVVGESFESIYEVIVSDRTSLLNELKSIEGIDSVSWLEHSGEMRG